MDVSLMVGRGVFKLSKRVPVANSSIGMAVDPETGMSAVRTTTAND